MLVFQPVGYWNIIDILDFEPYVGGAYPYIIRAVYWAAELGISVLLDLHGLPGSQNGQDNSGLSNIVSFQANQTNFDRAVAAIRNLTEEFSKEIYNGTVTSRQKRQTLYCHFTDCFCCSQPSNL
jgi:glucan 1,3-beta-glucosidase